jgi:hypothetical protein
VAVKNTLLKIAAAAAGITFALCIVVGCLFWYSTRPKPEEPPKPWNTAALTVTAPPSIDSYGNENHTFLRYDVRNHTNNDYSIDKTEHLRVMGKYPNGSLTSPIEDSVVALALPVFIPAQHSGVITLELKDPVPRKANVSDAEYHEQLRAHLNEFVFDGFAIFDEDNRCQIDMPKWLTVKPEPAPKP